MKKSLWQKYNKQRKFTSVDKSMSTDILIIGAGITGVSVAYNLLNTNHDIILIDKDICFNDTTAKTTGKITYLQDLKYQDIYKACGYEKAKLYYESQKDAIRLIKKNIKDNEIDCDLEKTEMVTFTKDESKIKDFELEKELLSSFGVKYSTTSNLKDDDVVRQLSVKNAYTFNPIKYLNGLMDKIKDAKNISVYENSIATKIKKEKSKYVTIVNGYEIRTNKIVLACSYPFFTLPGLIPLKTYLEKSYVSYAKIKDAKNIAGITSGNPFYSFRYYDDGKDKYIIYLNNSCKISDKLNYKKNYNDCKDEIKSLDNNLKVEYWTNMDVMTNDYLPLVGKISDDDKNVLIATGYNTWGMTNSAISAKLISDIIMGKKNKYKELFDPSRPVTFKRALNFVNNTFFGTLKAYTLNLIKKNPSWYKNKALATKIDGKRVGVYIDSKGEKHIVSNICPHLKCFLTFNEVDKTWDCPCHGSRFDVDGNVVKGPSCYNIKIDETNSKV